MSLRVIYFSPFKQGTALPSLLKMVRFSHPEVEFIPYEGKNTKGDVILCANKTKIDIRDDMRRVLFIGSIPTILKRKHMSDWDKIDHVLYLSDFVKKIVKSRYGKKTNSRTLFFGGLPADYDLNQVTGTRKIDGQIHFVSVAKWYKRPYKRLSQITELYNNYLKKEYPDSILHIIGVKKEREDGNTYYHRKSFHNSSVVDIFKKCHIQLIPTAFDTGPKTISESLHYRIPFVCSNNCAGSEYIDLLGKCGLEVETDPTIDSIKKYKSLDPLNHLSKFNKKQIPYENYFESIKEIVDNFEEYTSWKWNDNFNYKKQSDELYNALKG